jgi:hypothetical protein
MLLLTLPGVQSAGTGLETKDNGFSPLLEVDTRLRRLFLGSSTAADGPFYAWETVPPCPGFRPSLGDNSELQVSITVVATLRRCGIDRRASPG